MTVASLVALFIICLLVTQPITKTVKINPKKGSENTVSIISANSKITPDIEYLAKCIEAEAGNQGYKGKVYVCDCILNYYDLGEFKTYSEVINRKGAFECVSNRSIFKKVPQDETYQIILQEIHNRTNSEILYFRTKHYHNFGTPCFNYNSHYFSK